MKAFSQISKILGVTCVLLGLGTMDDPTLIGVVLILAGAGIAFGGLAIEEAICATR